MMAAALQGHWLETMLARNADCVYLRRFGSPRTLEAFRAALPLVHYKDLQDEWQRIRDGEVDVLFHGRPVGGELTSGSTSGPKWIVYSAEGLADFRKNIAPWFADVMRRYQIEGGLYLSISPVSRSQTHISGIPLGLPDSAYLDESAGALLAAKSVAPFALSQIADIETWRRQTIAHLRAATNLELVSVWSPTFLLRLLEDIPDPESCWPRLKLVSCWASAAAKPYADELRRRLPHAALQGKGLMSTEAVVTVPDTADQPVLAAHGFTEFLGGSEILLEDALEPGREYEVVITTASGLYRYRTGDRVQMLTRNREGRAVLEFSGRAMTSDMVGEKLSEAFVAACLQDVAQRFGIGSDFVTLAAAARGPGYLLVSATPPTPPILWEIESRLCANPHYAYARKLGQLKPLTGCHCPDALARIEKTGLSRGVRLGDIKPLALYTEPEWGEIFAGIP